MKTRFVFTAFLLLAICFGWAVSDLSLASAQVVRPPTKAGGSFTEGKDYLVLSRVRFLDRTGFDRPVEAFSLLFPQGWKTDGGVRWGSWQGCRGEMASNYIKASSPDGAIQIEVFPARSFGWTSDQQMLQIMQAGARGGGCGINQPFDARQYIDGFARRDLGGKADNSSIDTGRLPGMQQMDQQANNVARQFGNNSQQTTTIAFGNLSWPDGSQGILHVGVTNVVTRKPDFITGGTTIITTTGVFHCALVRFPASRREEASKVFQLMLTSSRTNPVWRQAKEAFLTQLGNQEHAMNMEKIRLMGEQARAYAQAQNAASNQRMRDWENSQNSQDRQHKNFVQAIREVETWKDSSGSTVELTSGYDQAWSRGDGRYILSNSPGFDPQFVLKDSAWQPLARER
jgi:hypothetical protein